MKRLARSIPVAIASVLFLAGSVVVRGNGLSASVNQQLAQARAASAKYHDPSAALADGYIELGPNPTEGGAIEFLNPGLVMDCTLDASHPESLRYVESGDGLRLIAVEYALPISCPDSIREAFLSGVGEWEQEAGVPFWMKPAFVWSGVSQADSGGD